MITNFQGHLYLPDHQPMMSTIIEQREVGSNGEVGRRGVSGSLLVDAVSYEVVENDVVFPTARLVTPFTGSYLIENLIFITNQIWIARSITKETEENQ